MTFDKSLAIARNSVIAATFVVLGMIVDQGFHRPAAAKESKPKDPVGYVARSGNGYFQYVTITTPDGPLTCMHEDNQDVRGGIGLSCNWEKFNKVGLK